MATANFKTMRDFPLIVAYNRYTKICPECGCGQCGTPDKCEICGADLSAVEEICDEVGMQDLVKDMEDKADALNENLTFYEVSVRGGYYTGVQFYVDEKYWKLEDMDEEDAQEEFGMCRSDMLRKWEDECNWLRGALRKAKKELGLMELGVSARFSNGETLYTEIKDDMQKTDAA